jgi:phage shock protein PspC (stress-responsive transcriptional regulator)
MPATGPLRRSTHNRIIAGVCAGIAEWRGWRPIWVRVAFVVGSLLPIVPGFVVYLVLWLLVPKAAVTQPGHPSPPWGRG